jgi:hypothetical protein
MAANSACLDLVPFISSNEYFVALAKIGHFERLLRKDDLFDDGVAAVFGLAGTEAELLGLCFRARSFTWARVASWLDERKFVPAADVSNKVGSPR